MRIAAGATAFAAATRLEAAQPYPVRPVRVVVGFPAGAGADLAARLMAQWLSERLGQPFIVENRPGAAGNVGAELVARAPRDGYTLLLINSSNAINATLYNNLNFNLIRDIAPVAGVFRGPFVMVVNPSFPAKSLVEFIAYAKANPGKINMASPGIGTTPHLAGELLNIMAGIKMIHVPYRGTGPALTDLLAGQVQMTFASMLSATQYIREGQLRALAVTSATRWDALPDLPTVADVLPGYEASAWFVVGAPTGTPAEIVDKLNSQINEGLSDPKMKARVAGLGGTVMIGAPADFAKLIAEETDKWGKVVKAAGIKAS
jgi:tripartite-type tricarboxylate transporter receptor subunit TctC